MNRKSKNRRRATILLMVVSLLALLFVIVTGFLSLARVDRGLTIEVQQAELADTVVQDTADWVIDLLADQLIDDKGRVLGGGDPESYAGEDIPGYRATNWLAPLEPVWNAAATVPPNAHELARPTWEMFFKLWWPNLTALDGSVTRPEPFPLYQLIPENADDRDRRFEIADILEYARRPFMDADGDGVPDAHFLLSGPATEAANTAAGTAVQLPRFGKGLNAFKVYEIPGPEQIGLNYEKWQRFVQQARYEVAVRVISHGGMLALDSPTLYDRQGRYAVLFNREFTMNTFSAINHPFDRRFRGVYPSVAQQNRVFDELHTRAAAVEPLLRRRYLLPPAAEPVRRRIVARRVIPILAELQGERPGIEGFPASLLMGTGGPQPVDRPTSYQRINLAAQGVMEIERIRWAQAVALDPLTYDLGPPYADDINERYDRRHLLTTISNSDELARKQDAEEPDPTGPQPRDLATYQGEQKFYLGEIAKAFDIDYPGPGQYRYNPQRGSVIIRELARRYYDMLASHSKRIGVGNDDWGDLRDPDDETDREVVSRRQQAFMLAVNTVAFAAPRDLQTTPGWIDLVTFEDKREGITYAGYAPQPFFTEVIAFNPGPVEEGPDEPGGGPSPPPGPGGPRGPFDPNDPNSPSNEGIAIAVELFNPNDPYYNPDAPTTDVFALNLGQFGISIDEASPDPNDPNEVKWFRGIPNMPQLLGGREFLTFVVKDSNGTDHFDATVGNRTVTIPLKDPNSATNFHINLWRRGHDGRQAVIDRIAVKRPEEGEWKRRARDTSPAAHFLHVDFDNDGVVEYARWNVVTGKSEWSNGTQDPNDPNSGPDASTLGNARFYDRTDVVRDPDVTNVRFAPTTPLITMNAAPFNDLPMFGDPGDLRPRSFPTVGFMLFIPRYAHAKNENPTTGEGHHTVSWCLREQWDRRHYRWAQENNFQPAPLSPIEYPVDFGHMPIFDNTQQVVNGTYLDEVGALPWGLLVFDYFTTIDPTRDANRDGQPDVDPLRIPGRININTAPWYLLANLPLMGPFDPSNPLDPLAGQLPIRVTTDLSVATAADPSPSFWDPWAGALVGQSGEPPDPNMVHRLLVTEYGCTAEDGKRFSAPYATYGVETTGRYRLGPWLAQAAVAYRDGIQCLPADPSYPFGIYADAHLRGAIDDDLPYPYPRYRDDVAGDHVDGVQTPGYGTLRGKSSDGQRPTEFGFVTIGELLNVKGFDSTNHVELSRKARGPSGGRVCPFADTPVARGDFVKAVSLLALLDSQYLTTRSNTFTIYASVMDREKPEASVRAQVTVDRSNLLPRLKYETYNDLGEYDPSWPLRPVLVDARDASGAPGQDGTPDTPVRTTNEGARPQVVARHQVGYYNAQFDD